MINSHDHLPAHIHAIKGDRKAKVEIRSGRVLSSQGFSQNDLKLISRHVKDQAELLMEKWNEIHKQS